MINLSPTSHFGGPRAGRYRAVYHDGVQARHCASSGESSHSSFSLIQNLMEIIVQTSVDFTRSIVIRFEWRVGSSQQTSRNMTEDDHASFRTPGRSRPYKLGSNMLRSILWSYPAQHTKIPTKHRGRGSGTSVHHIQYVVCMNLRPSSCYKRLELDFTVVIDK